MIQVGAVLRTEPYSELDFFLVAYLCPVGYNWILWVAYHDLDECKFSRLDA